MRRCVDHNLRRIKRIADVLLFLNQLSADQLGQLYELLQATKQIYEDPAVIAERELAEAAGVETEGDGIPKGQVLPDLAKKE